MFGNQLLVVCHPGQRFRQVLEPRSVNVFTDHNPPLNVAFTTQQVAAKIILPPVLRFTVLYGCKTRLLVEPPVAPPTSPM